MMSTSQSRSTAPSPDPIVSHPAKQGLPTSERANPSIAQLIKTPGASLRAFLATLLILFCASAFPASFDCASPFGQIEIIICENEELSGLDDQLSFIFRSAVAAAPDKKRLQREQLTWISETRNACEDAACLEQAYRSRLSELTADNAAGNQTPQDTPTPPPETTSATDEKAEQAPTPISQEDPQADEKPSQPEIAPPAETEAVNNNADKGESSLLGLKLAVLAILINVIYSIRLHKRERLIIYKDYTDATITGLAPLCGAVVYGLARFFEVPVESASMLGWAVFSILVLLIIRSTYKNNDGIHFFAMSLLTKVTIVGLYYAVMFILFVQLGSVRKKGERRSSFEARKRREAEQAIATMAATTTGFIALSAWVCRNPEFTPFREYISQPV